jgi:hypothetical protein
MRYEVTMERGDGWDSTGKLRRTTLVRVPNVGTLAEAEYFYRLFYLRFTGDCRSQATSGNWPLEDGRRIERSFTADVQPVDGWPNATSRTSVTVSIIEGQ